MIKTTMKIDGMMCGMCEAHVCDAIRKAVPAAEKVAASKRKKEASFLTDETVDADSLKKAIDDAEKKVDQYEAMLEGQKPRRAFAVVPRDY